MIERLRLLVIDDDLVDRLAIRRAIEQSTLVATIVEAADAGEALAKVASATFDCLLIDQDLRGTTGVTLASEIRATGNMVPIIFISDRQNEELLEQAVDAGVTDFIPKTDLSARRLALRIAFAIRIGKAEAESTRLLDQATAATRARDEILAVVSHDLRGPLHAISLASEALRDEITGTPVRYLGAIERATHRAERLIADLLEASAIENNGLTLARAAIDLCSVVRQAVADHELATKESGGKITAQLPSDPVMVYVDRERVLQVFANLVGNALKHAKGTPIEIVVERGDRVAQISVRDRGPGIPGAELPHVFNRYWSGRTKKGGAGLGLAIAKGIITAHGGTISVESVPGEGARFVFTLPYSA